MTPGAAHSRTQGSNDSFTSLIGSKPSCKPLGIQLFGLCFHFNSQRNKRTYHKVLVLFLTFIAYTAFHMGRRPLSVVKNVLNRNCSHWNVSQEELPNHHNQHQMMIDSTAHKVTDVIDSTYRGLNGTQVTTTTTLFNTLTTDNTTTNCSSWAPFDDNETANWLLAILDSAFLLSYALLMFISGFVAERANLRYFISVGAIMSGLGLIAFGLAHPFKIHSMVYFVVIQMFTGAFQSTGWPVVVTCVSNWFEPGKLGLIYGLWNSHTNFGNILGAVIAGYFVEKDWGLSFIVPGLLMIAVGILLFLLLVPTPQDVGLIGVDKVNCNESSIESASSVTTVSSYGLYPEHSPCLTTKSNGSGTMQLSSGRQKLAGDKVQEQQEKGSKAVSFWTALRIPGVIEYSLCLFFSKLVSYTFLYWLPRYITSSTSNNSEHSAYLSTPFDIGGIVGAILIGYLSDKFKLNAIICSTMLLLAIPSMFAYQQKGAESSLNNIMLQLLVGALVNGPYCLITTAVSADLGNRMKDGHAMATVAAIIDGMGSVGAVLGPLFAGFVSESGDWRAVFLMLMLADVLAALCLTRATIKEIKETLFISKDNSEHPPRSDV